MCFSKLFYLYVENKTQLPFKQSKKDRTARAALKRCSRQMLCMCSNEDIVLRGRKWKDQRKDIELAEIVPIAVYFQY